MNNDYEAPDFEVVVGVDNPIDVDSADDVSLEQDDNINFENSMRIRNVIVRRRVLEVDKQTGKQQYRVYMKPGNQLLSAYSGK